MAATYLVYAEDDSAHEPPLGSNNVRAFIVTTADAGAARAAAGALMPDSNGAPLGRGWVVADVTTIDDARIVGRVCPPHRKPGA